MERLFASHLAGGASRIMGRLAATKLPPFVLRPLISAYAAGVGVNLNEALEPEGGYTCFLDFFGRQLRPGTRPISGDADTVICPCDGKIVGFGEIARSDPPTFTIKGNQYSIDALLGGAERADSYGGGTYFVIYLHPRDYHRVHVPVNMELQLIRHIPGARFPVNGLLDRRVQAIYGKNERVVFQFEVAGRGALAIVMVAAFGVGNIESVHPMGSVPHMDVSRERVFSPRAAVRRGDELGSFLLGSTVVMLCGKGTLETDSELELGPVQMGRKIGRLCPSPTDA